MIKDRSRLAALSRFFSSAILRELAVFGRSSELRRLVEDQGFASQDSAAATVGSIFDDAFSLLKANGCRDEYIFRSALISKIVLGRHSLRTATPLNEFRIGQCKADLVVLNGTASVYEIKSDRDTLQRLPLQVKTYLQCFGNVNVVTSEKHVSAVLSSVPSCVGVMYLSNRYRLSRVRNAVTDRSYFEPERIYSALRVNEVLDVLMGCGIKIPAVPNTLRHRVLFDLFSEIDQNIMLSKAIDAMRRSRSAENLSVLIDRLPESLHAAALSLPVRRSDIERLVRVVEAPIEVVRFWE